MGNPLVCKFVKPIKVACSRPTDEIRVYQLPVIEAKTRLGQLHRAQRSQWMLGWYSFLGRHITEHRMLFLIASSHRSSKVELPNALQTLQLLRRLNKNEFFNKLPNRELEC